MNEEAKPDDFKLHVEMWRHYDNLRQAKNSAFLTANSILLAFSSFLFREPHATFISLVSLIGVVVCTSWLLLLTRNSAYIEYHREKAGGKKLWTPPNAGPIPSKWLDRVPAIAFGAFWLGALFFVICKST
jgi:hypothetical protein